MSYENPVLLTIRRHNEMGSRYRIKDFEPIDVLKQKWRIKPFIAFVAWCEPREYDPPDYLEALYRVSAPEKPKVLRTDLVRYEYEAFRRYKALRDGPNGVDATREASLVAITSAQEAVRRNALLTGSPALCFLQRDEHGLYDPRSRWCASCSLAPQCAAKINRAFGRDVVSLRRSHLVGS